MTDQVCVWRWIAFSNSWEGDCGELTEMVAAVKLGAHTGICPGCDRPIKIESGEGDGD